MKTNTLAFVFCALLIFSMSGQQAAKKSTPVVSTTVSSHNLNIKPSNLVTCDGILPNYTNAIQNGSRKAISQDYEMNNNAYDNMAADDFEVPGIGQTTICKVSIAGYLDDIGFAGDPYSEVVLRLFENANGLPGAMIYIENFPGSVDDDNDGNFILEPTEGPVLTGGTTYWLSVQAKLNFSKAGEWFWRTATDGNGELYAWQNPLDGFGNGCVTWSPNTACALPPPGPDLMMDISFNESLGTNSNSLETAVSIFPNPAKTQFTLQSDVALEKFTIYDVRGRMLSDIDLSEMSHEKTVDISSLASGVYMVRVTGDKGSVVKNLVKQ